MTLRRRICRVVFFFFEAVGFVSASVVLWGTWRKWLREQSETFFGILFLLSVFAIGFAAFLLRKTDRRLAEVGLVSVLVLILIEMMALVCETAPRRGRVFVGERYGVAWAPERVWLRLDSTNRDASRF